MGEAGAIRIRVRMGSSAGEAWLWYPVVDGWLTDVVVFVHVSQGHSRCPTPAWSQGSAACHAGQDSRPKSLQSRAGIWPGTEGGVMVRKLPAGVLRTQAGVLLPFGCLVREARESRSRPGEEPSGRADLDA